MLPHSAESRAPGIGAREGLSLPLDLEGVWFTEVHGHAPLPGCITMHKQDIPGTVPGFDCQAAGSRNHYKGGHAPGEPCG